MHTYPVSYHYSGSCLLTSGWEGDETIFSMRSIVCILSVYDHWTSALKHATAAAAPKTVGTDTQMYTCIHTHAHTHNSLSLTHTHKHTYTHTLSLSFFLKHTQTQCTHTHNTLTHTHKHNSLTYTHTQTQLTHLLSHTHTCMHACIRARTHRCTFTCMGIYSEINLTQSRFCCTCCCNFCWVEASSENNMKSDCFESESQNVRIFCDFWRFSSVTVTSFHSFSLCCSGDQCCDLRQQHESEEPVEATFRNA